MTATYSAWPTGTDPSAVRRRVARAHEEFVATGKLPRPLRGVVRDSWHRSRTLGVDPDSAQPGPAMADADLRGYREDHPLAAVLPVIRRLLVEPAREDDQLVAVGDEQARLLWVEGTPSLATRAEGIGFTEGAGWTERAAGTNAPGTALALGSPVQIYSSEHFSRPVQPWSCSASPIRDPDTGHVLGVIDLTGGDHIAAPHALSLVRATVAAAETELRLLRLRGEVPPAQPQPVPAGPAYGASVLEVLGRNRARLQLPHTTLELSPRHSEIVQLLARNPRGLTADALEVLLRETEAARVTVRAELSRLRRLLGPQVLASRPYRLLVPVATDAGEVRRLLAGGFLREALAAYTGPLLPESDAPGVVAAREELECELRGVLTRQADANLLLAWVERPENQEDAEMLQAAADALPPESSRAVMIRAQLQRILW